MIKKLSAATITLAMCMAPHMYSQHINQRNGIRRVLLISIDGMHAVDFLNCTNGISSINNGAPYCPALATLGKTGINYVAASTSKTSDSVPRPATAIVTPGGSSGLYRRLLRRGLFQEL